MENKTSLAKFACYWGSIFGSVIFLYQVLSVWIHFSGTFFQTLLYSLIVVFAMIFAYTKFRQTVGGGYLSFGRGLGLLSLMSLLMSAFFTLFAFVLVAKLDPSMLQEQINQVATLLESNDMDTSLLGRRKVLYYYSDFVCLVQLLLRLCGQLLLCTSHQPCVFSQQYSPI